MVGADIIPPTNNRSPPRPLHHALESLTPVLTTFQMRNFIVPALHGVVGTAVHGRTAIHGSEPSVKLIYGENMFYFILLHFILNLYYFILFYFVLFRCSYHPETSRKFRILVGAFPAPSTFIARSLSVTLPCTKLRTTASLHHPALTFIPRPFVAFSGENR